MQEKLVVMYYQSVHRSDLSKSSFDLHGNLLTCAMCLKSFCLSELQIDQEMRHEKANQSSLFVTCNHKSYSLIHSSFMKYGKQKGLFMLGWDSIVFYQICLSSALKVLSQIHLYINLKLQKS